MNESLTNSEYKLIMILLKKYKMDLKQIAIVLEMEHRTLSQLMLSYHETFLREQKSNDVLRELFNQ